MAGADNLRNQWGGSGIVIKRDGHILNTDKENLSSSEYGRRELDNKTGKRE